METMEQFLAKYMQEIITNYSQDQDGRRFQQEYFQYISSGELSFSYRWCVLTYNTGMFFKVNRRLDYAEQIFQYLAGVYDRKLRDQTERAQFIGLAGEDHDALASVYYAVNNTFKAMSELILAVTCYTEAILVNKKYMLKGAEAEYGMGLVWLQNKNYAEAEKALKNAVKSFKSCMYEPALDKSQIGTGLLKTLNSLGVMYYNQKRLSEAYTAHNEAAGVYDQVQRAGLVRDESMFVMVDVYSNMGNEYADSGNYDLARMYYNAALRFCDVLEGRMPRVSETRKLIQHNLSTLI